MENFSQILDDLKNRFSSRFVIYFILYWLVFHWPITVSLLWYDKSQFQSEGCKSIYEFIDDQLTNNYHWGKTFWFALGSTLAFPIIKSAILAVDEFIVVKRKNIISWIKKDELYQQNKDLENKISSVGDFSILKGHWEIIEFKSDFYGEAEGKPRQIYIKNDIWYDILNDKKEEGFIINDFFYNPNNLNLIFTIVLKLDIKVKKRYRLVLSGSGLNQKLEGSQDDKIKVMFNKISD